MHFLLLATTLGAALLRPALAQAGSGALWSERSATSAPLAQVPDFRTLARQVIPAVVSIATEQKVRRGEGPSPFGGDPSEFFHRYFGGEPPRPQRSQGLGSGFIIDSSGLILTNYHVVEDAESIEVTVAALDGSETRVKARTLGVAPNYDVALLRAEAPLGDAIAYLGNSDATDIGDWVMAVGNPFGLTHSVSVGIISAKERRDVAPSGRQGLYNFLQTDASINPGNSGGPLINMRGEVIGINSAINAAGAGIGFAIPINMVKEMLPELKAKGRYTRSWLGLKIQALTPELAQSFGLSRPTGALIAEVVPGGPGARAGLRAGDVVLSFDGKALHNALDLPLFASMAGTARRVPLTVFREGKELRVNVQLAAYPDEDRQIDAPQDQQQEASAVGMRLSALTPALQRELGLEQARGVVVVELDPAGPAARAGMRVGDVVVSINGRATPSMPALGDAIGKVAPAGALRFELIRQKSRLFVALRRPARG